MDQDFTIDFSVAVRNRSILMPRWIEFRRTHSFKLTKNQSTNCRPLQSFSYELYLQKKNRVIYNVGTRVDNTNTSLHSS